MHIHTYTHASKPIMQCSTHALHFTYKCFTTFGRTLAASMQRYRLASTSVGTAFWCPSICIMTELVAWTTPAETCMIIRDNILICFYNKYISSVSMSVRAEVPRCMATCMPMHR